MVFESEATNLVPDDTNGTGWRGRDIFVHDRSTGETTRVSVASDGSEANAASLIPSIDAAGRLIVFGSSASNLVPNDTNGVVDVFLHDRLTGATTRLSVGATGAELFESSGGARISDDGNVVCFASSSDDVVANDANGVADVFVRHLSTGSLARMSVATDGTESNGVSGQCEIDAGGNVVAFLSAATNLVSNHTDGPGVEGLDVFVHDRETGRTSIVSIATDGTPGDYYSATPSISADGRFVAFSSPSTTFSDEVIEPQWNVYVHDRLTGRTELISRDLDGDGFLSAERPALDADGAHVAYAAGGHGVISPPHDHFLQIVLFTRIPDFFEGL